MDVLDKAVEWCKGCVVREGLILNLVWKYSVHVFMLCLYTLYIHMYILYILLFSCFEDLHTCT